MTDDFTAVVESRLKRLREAELTDPVLAWVPQKVRLGEGDFRKVQAICKLIPEAFPDTGGDIEWYGYGIADPAEPDVTLDTILWEQDCTSVHTEVPGNSVAMVAQYVAATYNGQRIINQWKHSHNNMSAFFSGIDMTNAKKGLHSGFHNTKRPYQLPYEFKLIRGEQKLEKVVDGWKLAGSMSSDPVIFISEADVQGLSPERIQKLLNPRTHEMVNVGFYSSVVVTNRFATDPKEYRARIDWKAYNTIQNLERIGDGKEVEIEVVCGDNYKLVIDEAALLEELKKKIKPPYKTLFSWGKGPAKPWKKGEGSLQTAESEDGVWDWLGLPADIFETPNMTVLGEGKPHVVGRPVHVNPTTLDVKEFLVSLIEYVQRQQFNDDRMQSIHDILKHAATEGSMSLEKSPQAELLERINAPILGRWDDNIYRIILSDSLVKALLAYTETDQRFAELVKTFRGNTWNKTAAINRHQKPAPNKNTAPETNDKDSKDGKGNGDNNAKPGMGGWIA
ncbi:MAG: hypothetical protein HY438_04425 [DPANN group archaeon]|nr:hypothetical protein [DPANN group archaeon]